MHSKLPKDPEKLAELVCSRIHKGWSFRGEISLEEYKEIEKGFIQEAKSDLKRFKEKHVAYIW